MNIIDRDLIDEFGFRRCPECGKEYRNRVLCCIADVPDPSKDKPNRTKKCGGLVAIPFDRYRHLLATVRQSHYLKPLNADILASLQATLKDTPLERGDKRLVGIFETPGMAADYANLLSSTKGLGADAVAVGGNVFLVKRTEKPKGKKGDEEAAA